MEAFLYVLDADVFINLYRSFGKSALRYLHKRLQSEQILVPPAVARELKRKRDKLSKFAEKWVKPAKETISFFDMLNELERKYGEKIQMGKMSIPGFWHSNAGRRSADGQVVALAKVNRAVCVSNDQAIEAACASEGVECISWMEFARRIGLVGIF